MIENCRGAGRVSVGVEKITQSVRSGASSGVGGGPEGSDAGAADSSLLCGALERR
jgi:hypothetical protein